MYSPETHESFGGGEIARARQEVLDRIAVMFFRAAETDQELASNGERAMDRAKHPIEDLEHSPVPVPTWRVIKDLPFHEDRGMGEVTRLHIHIPQDEFPDESQPPNLYNVFFEMELASMADEPVFYLLNEAGSTPYGNPSELARFTSASGLHVWGLRPELRPQVSVDNPQELEAYQQEMEASEFVFLTHVLWMVSEYGQRVLPVERKDPQAA